MKKKLKIIGSGSHCKVIIDCALTNGYKIDYIIDVNSSKSTNEKIFGIPVNNKKIIKKFKKNDLVFLAIGNNKIRSYYFKTLKLKSVKFINLISNNSFVSPLASLGDGILVNNNCIINAGSKINDNCIINSGAIIEHDVIIGKNSHICPGVIIGGNTSIGQNCFIGLGSNIIDKIKIGSNTTLGSGSLVIKNIKSNQVFAGSPAKKIT
jgi:sugar O-acyltransferase (sialic acid O-acetyltransferase NeuD family)